MLVGDGAAARRRLALLDEAGADALEIYAPCPDPALALSAGARLQRRLPLPAEIARAQLVFVAGIPDPAAAEIRGAAQAAGVLINVEDDRRRSDFHSAAVFRRGDLTVAISTNGKSPGLAALMRRMLEHRSGRSGKSGSTRSPPYARAGVRPAPTRRRSADGRKNGSTGAAGSTRRLPTLPNRCPARYPDRRRIVAGGRE